MKYSWSLTSVCCFSARSAQGRIQGGAKLGHGGPLLQRTSSYWKATATNRKDSSDLEACGKKCCYFWFHFRSQIFDAFFDVFLDLVILVYFNAISIDFYEVKSFICIIFVYKWENASIGIFESPKCDVNPQPNTSTRGIGPLVGRTSGNRRSVMHVLAVIFSITYHFFFISQYISIQVILSGRDIYPLLMYPSTFLVF